MSCQQTPVLTRKIITILFSAIVFLAYPAGIQAETAALDAKDAAIQKEFDCITNAKAANRGFEWNDVCYVTDAKKASELNLSQTTHSDDADVYDVREYNLALNGTEEAAPENPANEGYSFSSNPSSTRENEFVLFGLVENKPSEPDSYAGRYGLFPDENSKLFSGGSVNVGYGLRQDDLVWSIGYPGGPNILSELTWDDVESIQLKGRADLTFYDHFVLDGMYAYGDVYDGTNQDSDYLGDFRTYEFSRSRNDSTEMTLMISL
ncbi:MAG: hypothetical protein WC450_00045 [Candidatus Omnitrophota bacterium]|jgi:hypothetical protein